jgi:hypothetical protein
MMLAYAVPVPESARRAISGPGTAWFVTATVAPEWSSTVRNAATFFDT